MTTLSDAAIWRRLRNGFIVLFGFVTPIPALAAPATSDISSPPRASERQIAAYHASPFVPSHQPRRLGSSTQLQEQVADARKMLMELQAFVEEAAKTIELRDELRVRRQEANRLRQSLTSTQAAKSAFQDHFNPMDIIRSSLTRTIVRNWLETVRLKYRSDDADRDLTALKESWLELTGRVASLKRTLNERRAEMLALRAQRSALSAELGRMHRQIEETRADARRFDRQRHMITVTTETLRRKVTSTLRAVLLESATR